MENGYHGIGGDGFEAEEVASAEEGRDDVEAGVVGGGTDEADVAFFDVGEEEVLLGLVEAVNFIDEKEGAFIGLVLGHAEDVAEFGDVGHDGIDADEVTVGFAGNDFGQGGFAASWRSVEHDAAKLVGFDELG